MCKSLQYLISFLLACSIAQASGIGGGGSGVHGSIMSNQLQQHSAVGTTPFNWSNSYETLDVDDLSLMGNTSGSTSLLGWNIYNDGVGYKYKTSHTAFYIANTSSALRFYRAASGTAGAAITPSQFLSFSGTDGTGTFIAPVTFSAAAPVTFSGSVTQTLTCVGGYSRWDGLDYCRNDTAPSITNLVTRDTCVAHTSPNGTAKTVYVAVHAFPYSANSIGLRYVNVYAYTDSGCTVQTGDAVLANGYEFTALPAGSAAIGSSQGTIAVKPASVGGTWYMKMTDDGGDQGIAYYDILGYSE